jgi:hypothetical protein
MNYPYFFDTIKTIKLQDDLSSFLGTFKDGFVEFSYLDIVKSAGHSCPTTAGAYLMTLEGLKALYKNKLPKRGEIFVSFKNDINDGTIGVIANIITQITGATMTSGFKGIDKKFIRHSLMKFNADISLDIEFQRLDTKTKIEVSYNPNLIPVDPLQKILMQKILRNIADNKEKEKFKQLWQKRVENIFKNTNKVITIK